MKTALYLLFCIWFFLPCTAYAYLDPGTGNALVYVVMSFIGAAAFSLKGIVYKLLGKSAGNDDASDEYVRNNIVIFNEGKMYWYTFKPVVEALIAQKVHFNYYTMDIHDPCLEIDNVYLHNQYIGNGNRAYVKIGTLQANVVLSTTPNIGTPGFPIPRSPNIKKLVHVFHAFSDMTVYHIGSLDNYDAVLMVGEFERDIIRNLEAVRHLPAKDLVVAGLPYMDELAKEKRTADEGISRTGKPTVLIAPSWSKKGCLMEYGTEFIADIARAGYNVIVRPHPQSLKVEKELIANAVELLSEFNNVVWDYDIDGSASMGRADIMISDASYVRLDFLLLYNKPVITLEIPFESMDIFERAYIGESWIENRMAELGSVLNHDTICNIVNEIEKTLSFSTSESIQQFRNKNLSNFMHSGEVIAEYLIDKSRKNSEV